MTDLSRLFDEKVLKLMQVLYLNKDKLYHLTQLASESKVSSATTLRLMSQLIDSDYVKISTVGKLKIYSYNDSYKNNQLMRVIQG